MFKTRFFYMSYLETSRLAVYVFLTHILVIYIRLNLIHKLLVTMLSLVSKL